MIANYYKPGPGTSSSVKSRIADPSTRDGDADAGQWWVSDNYVVGSPDVTADNWKGVTRTTPAFRLDKPWPAMEIRQQTAEEAYISVLGHAGCSFPNRDSIDIRIIEEVRNGTSTYGNNGLIIHPNDVGGWPTLVSKPAPDDSDHDGMPDSWETANGLNSNDPEDRNGIGERGYTNLEIYLNSLVGHLATSIHEFGGFVPAEFMLEQNYPNPFNPKSIITYKLPAPSFVNLSIYNLLGQKVNTLISERQPAGRYLVEWNATGFASGIYHYFLEAGEFRSVNKMVLVR
jgi:hypothetical protein